MNYKQLFIWNCLSRFQNMTLCPVCLFESLKPISSPGRDSQHEAHLLGLAGKTLIAREDTTSVTFNLSNYTDSDKQDWRVEKVEFVKRASSSYCFGVILLCCERSVFPITEKYFLIFPLWYEAMQTALALFTQISDFWVFLHWGWTDPASIVFYAVSGQTLISLKMKTAKKT